MDKVKNNEKNWEFEYPLAALISILYRTHNVHMNHIINKYGLTSGQIPFILHLKKRKNISQEDFANDLFIDKGTVAIALKKLEKNEIVKRKRLEDNKRKYSVYFTEKGGKIARKIEKLNEKWEKKILEDFDDFDKEKIMELFSLTSLKSIEILENSEKP
jgi:DNA-binding MarR family transcriptional regulator